MKPLPLTPFEFAMLMDDRPAYPMNIGVRLDFTGSLDGERFRDAVRLVASRHPRLVGRIHGPAASRPKHAHWLPSDMAIEYRRCELPGGPTPIDIARGPAVRVTHEDRGAGSSVLFDFHHTAVDGLGLLAFLEELFAELGHVPPAVDRPARPAEAAQPSRGWARAKFVWKRIAKFFRQRPQPLSLAKSGASAGAAWSSGRLSADELAGLKAASKRLGVTLNDLLIREMFLTIEEWNAGQGEPGRLIRLGVPINTRGESSNSSANDVSMVFLDRTVPSFDDQQLMDTIGAEMAEVRRERLGSAMQRALAILARIPGGIRRIYAAERCQSTTVLSNIGVLFPGQIVRLGQAELAEITYFAPVRPLTRISFVIVTYRGNLSIGCSTDTSALSGADGQGILASFVARLRLTASQP